MAEAAYRAEPVRRDGTLAEVRIVSQGESGERELGSFGGDAEARLAEAVLGRRDVLPVFLGSGLGTALQRVLVETDLPVAVVDKERPILALTGCESRFSRHPRVLWAGSGDAAEILRGLTRWRLAHGGAPFLPVSLPLYSRLAPGHYGRIRKELADSRRLDFRRLGDYPRFASDMPRVLLLRSPFFLYPEIESACQRLDAPLSSLPVAGHASAASLHEAVLRAVAEFRPDFVLTVNHYGVDGLGGLTDLLRSLSIPLASWFVDSPEYILYRLDHLASPLAALFVWDKASLRGLSARGWKHVHHLPLATDPERFRPRPTPFPADHPWRARVSFVGNTWAPRIAEKLRQGRFPRELLLAWRPLAEAFLARPDRSPGETLAEERPDLLPAFEALATLERKRLYETAVAWEATRLSRRRCVEQILPFAPLVAGDPFWKTTFRAARHPWRWCETISYYHGLADFYALSEVNFNCTSVQMRGAVNQRLFDVPACGGFVLTDWRDGLEELFDPGTELALYHDPADIPEAVRRWLDDPAGRKRIALAARRRVLAQHTYEARLRELFAIMRRAFA